MAKTIKIMKKQLFLFVLILLPMVANADVVKIKNNGVYYCLIEYNKEKYAEVTSMSSGKYTGSVVISSTVTFDNVTYSVKSIGNSAFKGCSGLTSVTIPNSVKSIKWEAFYGCTGLTSITIPNSVTRIGGGAFKGCSGLTSITIPNSVTYIESEAFMSCSGLTSITIPNSVTYIGSDAFSGCKGLTSITIPNSVPYIGYWTFSHCTGLTSITIGNSVTSIGDYAFAYCTSLESINIPSSVTSIEQYAFKGCSGLTSVTIPNSVTSIGWEAFMDCTGLTDFYCYAEKVPTTWLYVFSSTPVSSATLHVPAASIYAYKAADPWKKFGTIVAITPEGTGVESITATDNPSDRKFMENGRLIIQKNGQRYNVAGQMVKEK